MPIDEQRHFRPPTGDSSAANNYDRKGKGKRVRGSVESRNSCAAKLGYQIENRWLSTRYSTLPKKNRNAGPFPRSRWLGGKCLRLVFG